MKIEIHRELNESTRSEWLRFLDRAGHQHPRQDPKFASLEQANGNTPLYIIGRKNDAICALGIFSLRPSKIMPRRYSTATSLSGPVCDDPESMISFLSEVAGSPAFAMVGALKITPYWLRDDAVKLSQALTKAGWTRLEAEAFRHTGLIDLQFPDDELRASFSRSARRKIKAVEQENIIIREIHEASEAEVFFDRLDHFILARHSLTQISRLERDAIVDNVCRNPKLGVLLGAFQGRDFLGGFLIYRSNHTAHAARYVADLDNAKLRVASSLWLEGMLWAKRQGCTTMDVEGYEDVSDISHPKFNIYEYKRQFRPVHVERIAEYMLPLNKFIYAMEQAPQRTKQLVKSLRSLGKK